jgi:hypothetical protein
LDTDEIIKENIQDVEKTRFLNATDFSLFENNDKTHIKYKARIYIQNLRLLIAKIERVGNQVMIEVVQSNIVESYKDNFKKVFISYSNCFSAVVSRDILDEYEKVLKRPKFNFDHKYIKIFLDYLKNYSEYTDGIIKTETFSLPHADDLKFVEAGVVSGADYSDRKFKTFSRKKI